MSDYNEAQSRKLYSLAGLMSSRRSDGKSDFVVLHGVRAAEDGQGVVVSRYIQQSLQDNPGYAFCTPVSCIDIEAELNDEVAVDDLAAPRRRHG